VLEPGERWRVIEGDALAVLATLPAASFDAVVTDPPYPCIDRPYGRWTEAEWLTLMDGIVPECRRLLKPSGSAVFVLQPNAERVGRMRLWLWDFLAKWGREWGVVQDAYWWNPSTLPVGGANRHGLMRPSVRYMAWLGPPDCYRDQGAVLLSESEDNRMDRTLRRHDRAPCPSRVRSAREGPRDDYKRLRSACVTRGGTTPFNLLACGSDGRWSGGVDGHPASTPLALCHWWVRYLCPPGGLVLDPFAGSGTTLLAALAEGRRAVGIERSPDYCKTARRRLGDPDALPPTGGLFAGLA
jgi:hypothetical protein